MYLTISQSLTKLKRNTSIASVILMVSLLIYMTFLNRRLRLLKPQLLIFNLRISALKIRTLARLRNLHALLAYLLDGGHATHPFGKTLRFLTIKAPFFSMSISAKPWFQSLPMLE